MRRKYDLETLEGKSDCCYRGAVVSVFTGGACIGAALAGPTGDRLGRKWTIFIGAVIFILGGGLQTGAQNLGYLYAGRAIAGLGYVHCKSKSTQSDD